MDKQAAREPGFRFERKFHISDLQPREVETLVRVHPALFLETYPPRQVNNIYLDSVDLKSFKDNLDGVADRAKVRVRWYGDLMGRVDRPTLELKRKMGLVGDKVTVPLEGFLMDRQFDQDTLTATLARAEIPGSLRALLDTVAPTLLNCYRRSYYRSADRRVRLTLDTDRRFYRVRNLHNNFLDCWEDKLSTILELKYDLDEESRAAEIANLFPFRLTKSSKYAQGLENLGVP